jgi:glycosyltransferase involved in cell wall biosynthesis
VNREGLTVGGVILSANVSHYYHTALALQQAGILQRYICAIGFARSNPWYVRFLPNHWRRKLRSRDISGIDGALVRTIWIAEILQRGLPAMGLISWDRGNCLNNYLYDILAQRWIEPCDVFHFVSSVGLYSARKAKAAGGIVVCDVRTEYPDYQFQVLGEEYARLGLYYNPPGLSYDNKIKAEYALADYIIVPSRYAQRTFVEAGFDAGRVLVLPYGVDPTQFFVADQKEVGHAAAARLSSSQQRPFRVIFVGQIVPRKGVHYLLEAFHRLSMDDMELLLVGHLDETMAPIVHAAVERDARIRIVDNVPKAELQRLYSTAAVLVLPSLADSWGLVVLEAMACGLPVIVSENSGSSEVVSEGVNGFVVPIRDVDAIEEKLDYLYIHSGALQQMGQAAHETVKHYTWQCYGQRLIQYYRDVFGVTVCRAAALQIP